MSQRNTQSLVFWLSINKLISLCVHTYNPTGQQSSAVSRSQKATEEEVSVAVQPRVCGEEGEGGREEEERVQRERGKATKIDNNSVESSHSGGSSEVKGQRGVRRDDSCDVSIRLTRATPERLFRDEGEIEGQEGDKEEEEEGAVKKEEVDGETEFVCNSDDDDSHTTGSSTSCNTPDPTGLAGDLTPTNGVTPAYSDPKLFHEDHQRLLIQEREERPASCPPPPVDHSEEISEEIERETQQSPSSSATNNELSYEGGPPLNEAEGGVIPVEGSGQLLHTLQNGALGEVDSSFDTLPELTSLRDTPQFRALAAGEGGRGGAGEEVVRLVIAPNMVQVLSADGSKVILRRTIRSIACCTQVYVV